MIGPQPIVWLDAVDSTNAEALRRRAPGWIAARRQTSGRGRRGRPWGAGTGDLAASLSLAAPDGKAAELATLSFAAALATADLCDRLLPPDLHAAVTLKWPNDVLIRGRKVAGLLLENAAPWLVVGVGVNLSQGPEPAVLEAGATPPIALSELRAPPRPETALEILAEAFEARFAQWREGGFAATRADWLSRAAGLGGPARARLPGEEVSGRFVDVDADGAFVLDTPAGKRRIHAADIHFAGPAGDASKRGSG